MGLVFLWFFTRGENQRKTSSLGFSFESKIKFWGIKNEFYDIRIDFWSIRNEFLESPEMVTHGWVTVTASFFLPEKSPDLLPLVKKKKRKEKEEERRELGMREGEKRKKEKNQS